MKLSSGLASPPALRLCSGGLFYLSFFDDYANVIAFDARASSCTFHLGYRTAGMLLNTVASPLASPMSGRMNISASAKLGNRRMKEWKRS
jgi:hypothetical protein